MSQEESEITYTNFIEVIEKAIKKLKEDRIKDKDYIFLPKRVYEAAEYNNWFYYRFGNPYFVSMNKIYRVYCYESTIEVRSTLKPIPAIKPEYKNFAKDYLMRGKKWNNKK